MYVVSLSPFMTCRNLLYKQHGRVVIVRLPPVISLLVFALTSPSVSGQHIVCKPFSNGRWGQSQPPHINGTREKLFPNKASTLSN